MHVLYLVYWVQLLRLKNILPPRDRIRNFIRKWDNIRGGQLINNKMGPELGTLGVFEFFH